MHGNQRLIDSVIRDTFRRIGYLGQIGLYFINSRNTVQEMKHFDSVGLAVECVAIGIFVLQIQENLPYTLEHYLD